MDNPVNGKPMTQSMALFCDFENIAPFNPGVTRLTASTTILEKRTESYVKAKKSQHPARMRVQEERA